MTIICSTPYQTVYNSRRNILGCYVIFPPCQTDFSKIAIFENKLDKKQHYQNLLKVPKELITPLWVKLLVRALGFRNTLPHSSGYQDTGQSPE